MSFWNGAFDRPDILKHRDYLHNSFAEHLLDNGPAPVIERRVRVHTNPLTQEPYNQNRTFYLVRILIGAVIYFYLIPSSPEGDKPSEGQIEKWINDYNENPVEGGRHWEDYVVDSDLDELEEILNG